jgi:hypothetical protein
VSFENCKFEAKFKTILGGVSGTMWSFSMKKTGDKKACDAVSLFK